MRRYRAAIVGCGRIGSSFDKDPKRTGIQSHAGAYQASRQMELVAVCDLRSDRLKAFGRRWGVTALYADYQKMFQAERLDLVSICTWSESHHEIAQAACAAGVQAIFCEKPIADSPAHAQALLAAARDHGVVLAVDHWRRWDPFYQQVARWIRAGRIGRIERVVAWYKAGIANTGPHLFDLVRWLVGEVEAVRAHCDPKDQADDPSPEILMTFTNGARGVLVGCRGTRVNLFELDLVGSIGRIRFTAKDARAELWKTKPARWPAGYWEPVLAQTLTRQEPVRALWHAVQDLARCLTRGGQPQCTGEDGQRALELILAVHESLAKREAWVKLPPPAEGGVGQPVREQVTSAR